MAARCGKQTMATRVTSLCLLSALALVAAGCSSSSKAPEENPNVYPSNYKDEILNTMTTMLDDPTNVRSAYISDPVISTVGKEGRYTVCVRSDSRNANKEYTGSKDRIGYFYAGHLNQLVGATREQCGNAAYKPFPELEKLCQARKCA
jgi:hypothetical protein